MKSKLQQRVAETKEHMDLNYDHPEPFDDDEDNSFTDEDALEELLGECGQGRDGYCTLAGTEYCDFECPFSG